MLWLGSLTTTAINPQGDKTSGQLISKHKFVQADQALPPLVLVFLISDKETQSHNAVSSAGWSPGIDSNMADSPL